MADGDRGADAVQPQWSDDDGADRGHEGVEPHVARVFNPDRKDTHWGKRKLKRDE